MESDVLKGRAVSINERAKFSCQSEGRPEVIVDYIPPHGDGEGYTSLELFLLSLTSCLSFTVKALLTGPMKKNIAGITGEAMGTRRAKHPTCFEKIDVMLKVEGDDVSNEDMDRVIAMAEGSLCPVYAMVKGNVEIAVKYSVSAAV